MQKRKVNYSIRAIVKKISYYFILGILTYLTISFSSKNYEKLDQARTYLFANFAFTFKILNIPFMPIQAIQNTEETEKSIVLLKKLFWEVAVQKEELVLSSLKMLRKSVFDLNFQNDRLIFITPSYYSSSGFLTDVIFNSSALSEEDLSLIQPNMAVISEKGFYGRVTAIAGTKLSIISIYNTLSRIPVYTKTSKVYGMASGGGSEIYFTYPSEDTLKLIEDEIVFTSGENNLVISEIPFGKVQKINGKFIIVPFSKTRPEILGILSKS